MKEAVITAPQSRVNAQVQVPVRTMFCFNRPANGSAALFAKAAAVVLTASGRQDDEVNMHTTQSPGSAIRTGGCKPV